MAKIITFLSKTITKITVLITFFARNLMADLMVLGGAGVITWANFERDWFCGMYTLGSVLIGAGILAAMASGRVKK